MSRVMCLVKAIVITCILLIKLDGSDSIQEVNQFDDGGSNILVAVVQIYRHGIRTPYSFYKNDPHFNLSIWEGLGAKQLMNEGKRQHYSLGQFTRQRYADFLPERYDKDVITAYTTDSDRTHMSGQCNLYGLFPAKNDQIWKENLSWQPIPLQLADPNILYSEPYQCANYVQLVDEVWKTEEYAAVNQKYKSTYEYISKHSGENITDALSTWNVFDCLDTEHKLGLQLPEWANTIYPEPLTYLNALSYKSFTGTTLLKQLGAGRLLNQIITYFDAMASNTLSTPKIITYSAHDENIASILNCFGAFDTPYVPTFASSIWMELKEMSGNFYVNVFSRDSSDMMQIKVKNCNVNCPFDQFKLLLKDIVVDYKKWNEICTPS
uniref:acid phosphatase n=1 Tax=Diabrotica virgifera virgifera TaxID=50390 RepID=A0A6P7H0A7_DIAVI